MVPSLKEAEPLTTGYRRIATECVDTALAALDASDGRDAAVHTIRKQCKQLRALIRLLHAGSAAERRQECLRFRDLGRSLSVLRDARVALDIHTALIERYGDCLDPAVNVLIRQRLIANLQASVAVSSEPLPPSDALRLELLAAKQRARRLETGGEAEASLRESFVRTYRRARRAGIAAAEYGHVEDFHEARKRSKDYWYQLEFLSRRWPGITAPRTSLTRRLTEVLGESQDYAVYRSAIEGAATSDIAIAAELLSALAAGQEQTLREEALTLFPQVFGEKPGRLAAEIGPPEPLHQAAG